MEYLVQCCTGNDDVVCCVLGSVFCIVKHQTPRTVRVLGGGTIYDDTRYFVPTTDHQSPARREYF